MFAQRPQRMDVLIGPSKVVSTLNIGLPASGIRDCSGIQEEISSASNELSASIDSPTIKRMIPPIDMGAEM